ncbi:MAG: energy transducer TonB [Clostridia bacterium]
MTAAAAHGLGGGRFMGERREPGYIRAFALAFGVHALLIAILFLGVRLQSHAPDTVTVELWEPPAPQRVQPPPPPPAPPKVEPEPPKPEPKIEKPEIVEKALPKPKPEPKKPEPKKVEPPPKPLPKKAEPAKPVPPKRDLDLERRMREQLAQEQAAAQDRQIRDMVAKEQAAAQSRGLATWVDKIRIKIRGNIPTQVLDDVKGNPEAIYDVTLLPTGDVLNAKMRKSSGNAAYDDAVYRAILKSSPLPKPDQPGLFQRQLELHFRPQDR